MRKGLILLTAGLIAYNAASAQINVGGYPWSVTQNLQERTITPHEYALPNWSAYLEQEQNDKSFTKPYMVALFQQTNVGFPSSGSFVTMDNGDKIWKTQILIKDAPGMGFYFDQFNLPKGVSLYITNKNGKHVLGGYTQENNNEFNNFATEALEGELATLELNIPAFVNEESIALNIEKVAVYFRAIDNLQAYKNNMQTIDLYDDQLFKTSSVCAINAICPQGELYPNQRKAALQQLMEAGGGVAACSGTMINNLANTEQNCEQYYFTASHCEQSGTSRSDATFSRMLLRFQFETATCTATTAPESKTLTGAKFVSRSAVNLNNAGSIKGDFMLLKPNNKIPSSWGVPLIGWNANDDIERRATAPQKFINFSHPGGDVKKVFTTNSITSTSNGAVNANWGVTIANGDGVVMQGTSGSGLFNPAGEVIGSASVASPGGPASCNVDGNGSPIKVMNYILFSKMSYVWEYTGDGGAANSQLKPWLDPNNTGRKTVSAVTSECKPLSGGSTSINKVSISDDQVNIFPNPSINGKVTFGFNLLEKLENLSIQVIDIHGKVLQSGSLASVQTNNYELDLSGFANGIYMIRLADNNTTITKKLIINK